MLLQNRKCVSRFAEPTEVISPDALPHTLELQCINIPHARDKTIRPLPHSKVEYVGILLQQQGRNSWYMSHLIG